MFSLKNLARKGIRVFNLLVFQAVQSVVKGMCGHVGGDGTREQAEQEVFLGHAGERLQQMFVYHALT